MNPLDWIYVIAIVKGSYERDLFAHFGSLLALDHHVNMTIEAGLALREGYSDIVLTKAGRRFYEEYRLGELPEGRATGWLSTDMDVITPAAEELAKRKEEAS